MDTLFSLVPITLKCLSLSHFKFECCELVCQLLGLLSSIIALLLSCCASILQYFELFLHAFTLLLSHFESFKRVFVSLGKLDEPLSNLLQKAIDFFQLVIQMLTTGEVCVAASLICGVMCWDRRAFWLYAVG